MINYPTYAVDKKRHPYWNFHKIMELEEKYDATSSFYFLAHEPEEQDYRYSLETIKDDIRYIDARGWEVGLHGSHESYNNYDDLLKRKEKLESILGKPVIGYRNHYLRFKTPDTWELLSKAGFKYDTTFGYNDCAGFRNGMCHPFKPFNLNTGKEIGIIEIPLTIMDGTLLGDYMRLDFEAAWNLVEELIDKVEQCRGVITILWHNHYMQGEKLNFYERILKYCYEKDAWMTSGRQIYEWYSQF
jgi:peptidoglycan/xylan/chitin deacetylase (PgdA/CDA1 family)